MTNVKIYPINLLIFLTKQLIEILPEITMGCYLKSCSQTSNDTLLVTFVAMGAAALLFVMWLLLAPRGWIGSGC